MLSKYDQDVVKTLMPLIVNVLGNTFLFFDLWPILSSGQCLHVGWMGMSFSLICIIPKKDVKIVPNASPFDTDYKQID